jgi:hypothetical protein
MQFIKQRQSRGMVTPPRGFYRLPVTRIRRGSPFG